MEAWYNKGVHFVKFDQYPMTPQIHPLPDSYKDWYLTRQSGFGNKFILLSLSSHADFGFAFVLKTSARC